MITYSDLPIRDDLRDEIPYGAPQLSVPIMLNVNENPFPIRPEVASYISDALNRVIPGVNRYPDREFTELRRKLAEFVGHGATEEHIWAANGSNEVLMQLFQVFAGAGRKVLGFPPTFPMYAVLSKLVGSQWVGVAREKSYQLTPEDAAAAVKREQPDVVVICNPNNPDGTLFPLSVIEAVYEATDGIVIVDEAYAEFVDPAIPSALTLLEGRERLIVCRTMSKAFAYAGVRLGYMVCNPAVCDAVRIVRLPYHLSEFTQTAAVAALECHEQLLDDVAAINAQRDRIFDRLQELGYLPVPSHTNFVLFFGVENPHGLFDYLLERGILLRDLGVPFSVRVSAGSEAETTAFLEALEEYTAEHPPLTLEQMPDIPVSR